MNLGDIIYREELRLADVESVRQIVTSSGFFSKEEVELAVELAQERSIKGELCSYYFVFAELNKRVVGYSCYGPIPCTQNSCDLYWIAVLDDFRGKGIGRRLLERTEKKIAKMGGKRIYVDTSSRDQYKPTRSFYLDRGYEQEAVLRDFYSPGDDKVILVKELNLKVTD